MADSSSHKISKRSPRVSECQFGPVSKGTQNNIMNSMEYFKMLHITDFKKELLHQLFIC